MKTSTSLIAIATVLSAASLLTAAPAYAGKMLYPGSNCVRWNSGMPVPVLNHSRIFNTTGKWMKVDCPIPHTNFKNRTGNNLDDADIGVIDNHGRYNAKCWLANRYQIGANVFGGSGGTRVTTNPPGSHEQNLDFGGTGRHPENWYYIGCQIPPTDGGRASGITYYSAEQ